MYAICYRNRNGLRVFLRSVGYDVAEAVLAKLDAVNPGRYFILREDDYVELTA